MKTYNFFPLKNSHQCEILGLDYLGSKFGRQLFPNKLHQLDYTIFTIEERRFNFYDDLDKRMPSFFAIAVWGKSNFNAIWFLASILPLVLRNEGGASFVLTIGN